MHINDILAEKGYEVYCIDSHQTVHDAIAVMTRHNVGAVLIMEKDNIKGIVTRTDIILSFSHQGDVDDHRITELMSTDVITCKGEDNIEHILNVMNHHKINYLPVINNNKINGIISQGDLMKSIIKDYQFQNRLLKRYIQTWPEENRNNNSLKLIVNNKSKNPLEFNTSKKLISKKIPFSESDFAIIGSNPEFF